MRGNFTVQSCSKVHMNPFDEEESTAIYGSLERENIRRRNPFDESPVGPPKQKSSNPFENDCDDDVALGSFANAIEANEKDNTKQNISNKGSVGKSEKRVLQSRSGPKAIGNGSTMEFKRVEETFTDDRKQVSPFKGETSHSNEKGVVSRDNHSSSLSIGPQKLQKSSTKNPNSIENAFEIVETLGRALTEFKRPSEAISSSWTTIELSDSHVQGQIFQQLLEVDPDGAATTDVLQKQANRDIMIMLPSLEALR